MHISIYTKKYCLLSKIFIFLFSYVPKDEEAFMKISLFHIFTEIVLSYHFLHILTWELFLLNIEWLQRYVID